MLGKPHIKPRMLNMTIDRNCRQEIDLSRVTNVLAFPLSGKKTCCIHVSGFLFRCVRKLPTYFRRSSVAVRQCSLALISSLFSTRQESIGEEIDMIETETSWDGMSLLNSTLREEGRKAFS